MRVEKYLQTLGEAHKEVGIARTQRNVVLLQGLFEDGRETSTKRLLARSSRRPGLFPNFAVVIARLVVLGWGEPLPPGDPV
jgi:hypothetical protein